MSKQDPAKYKAWERAKYKRLTFKVDRLTWEKLTEEDRKKRIDRARGILKDGKKD